MQIFFRPEPSSEDGPADAGSQEGRLYNDHDLPAHQRSGEGGPAPDKGILSHTLLSDDRLKAVLFSFTQGEELSEHTASMPPGPHFLQGESEAGR